MQFSFRPDVRALPQALLVACLWLFALAIAGWTAAGWYWRIQAPEPHSAAVEPVVDTATAAQNIASRQLFGTPIQASQANVASTSNLVLTGVQTRWGKLPGFAVLVEGNSTPHSVVEGEDVSNGIKLVKVFADGVEIERNGVREQLHLQTTTPTAPAAPDTQAPQPPAPPQASAPADN